MTHETVLIGPLTRDFTLRDRLRWSQPGGAVWHAGLALALAAPLTGARVSVYGTAGPWAGRYGLPGLAGAGIAWRGIDTAIDTTFVNRYDPDRRRQSLISRAEPLALSVLADCDPAAAVVSPLMPGDVPSQAARALRARGAFVGADAQGLLRVAGPGGRIETRSVNLRDELAGAQAIKFAQREFRVYAGLRPEAPWRAAALAVAAEQGAEIVVSLGPDGAAVALPLAAAVIEAPSPSLQSAADATGAGDILIATYTRARSGGLDPAGALERAVRQTHTVLRRRAEGAPRARPAALLAAIRALQVSAALVRRRVRRGDPCPDSFRPDGPLAGALSAQFSAPLPLGGDAASRGAAMVSACWALYTTGWPTDDRLSPASLLAFAGEEQERLEGRSSGTAGR